MNRARVASRKGAPRIAPIPISPAAAPLVPRIREPMIATSGIMVSGNAVPTAASTLPTAPAPRFNRSPMISTALVKRIAAPSIATRDRTNSIIVKGTPYDHLRQERARFLPAGNLTTLGSGGYGRTRENPGGGRERRTLSRVGRRTAEE